MLVHALKSPDGENKFIFARSRGGLVVPCENLLGILEQAELSFRRYIDSGATLLRNNPPDAICA